jgi:predicted transcriptional regulator
MLMRKMLLSISPEHVENILNGTKMFEFRKTRCRETLDTIVIYSTAPKMRVVAEATVEDIIIGDVLEVWRQTKAYAGISFNYYRSYYKGKKFAVAYKLGTVTVFDEPLTLSAFGICHPPQSFAYLPKRAIAHSNGL